MKYNLLQFFIETANLYPDRIALVTSEGRFNYSDIRDHVLRLASFLRSKGIKKGDRVMIIKENGYSTIISLWAILLCGGIASCLSHRNLVTHLITAIRKSEPKFLIIDGQILTDDICAELMKIGQNFLTTDINELKVSEKLDELYLGSVRSVSFGRKELDEPDHDSILNNQVSFDYFNCAEIISKDIAVILYTSGSTGNQKGVTLTHGNMIAALTSIVSYLELRGEDTIVSTLPLSFDYGLYQMLMVFSLGAKLVLEEESIWSIDLLKKIEKHQATVLPIVPTLANFFGSLVKNLKFDLSSIRMVTSTAERLTVENINMLQTLFPKAQIYSMYGLTECKRCTYVPPDMLAKKKGSTGKAIPNTEIRIIDANENFCLPYQEGELVIRGANVMRGYWKDPVETAKAFLFDELGNKWLRTGDFGYLDEEGYFFNLGRRDSIVKIRGMKVSLIEIEEIVAKMPFVREVGIVTKNHPTLSVQIVAFVSTSETISLSSIQKYCKQNLRDFQIPSVIKLVDHIPKSINGKIDRKALSELIKLETQNSHSMS